MQDIDIAIGLLLSHLVAQSRSSRDGSAAASNVII